MTPTNCIWPVDWLAGATITQRTSVFDPTTTPATGLGTVSISYADAPGGSPIDATLQQPATETVTAGSYQAAFAGTDLANFLPDRIGRDIYECVWIGTLLYEVTALMVIAAP